jgi:arginine repressor
MKKNIEAEFIAGQDHLADCFTKSFAPATQTTVSRIGMSAGMQDD